MRENIFEFTFLGNIRLQIWQCVPSPSDCVITGGSRVRNWTWTPTVPLTMKNGSAPGEDSQGVQQIFQQHGYFSSDSKMKGKLHDVRIFCLI